MYMCYLRAFQLIISPTNLRIHLGKEKNIFLKLDAIYPSYTVHRFILCLILIFIIEITCNYLLIFNLNNAFNYLIVN